MLLKVRKIFNDEFTNFESFVIKSMRLLDSYGIINKLINILGNLTMIYKYFKIDILIMFIN